MVEAYFMTVFIAAIFVFIAALIAMAVWALWQIFAAIVGVIVLCVSTLRKETK